MDPVDGGLEGNAQARNRGPLAPLRTRSRPPREVPVAEGRWRIRHPRAGPRAGVARPSRGHRAPDRMKGARLRPAAGVFGRHRGSDVDEYLSTKHLAWLLGRSST